MIFTVTLNPALDHELTVLALNFDEVLRAQASRFDCGGKGFNVSRALAALGGESVAMGFVGGPTGERLENTLQEMDIATDFVHIGEETRTNVSIVTGSGEGCESHYIKVNEAGPYIIARELYALHQKVCEQAKPGDWWVFSGSLPRGVPAKIYHELVCIVQDAGARAVVDVDGEALRWGCKAKAFLVKPNRSEAAKLTGLPLDTMEETRAAVAVIHEMGAQHIALSLGKDGALLSDGMGMWVAEPPPIIEANPIGAGDAMVAGMVWALSRGESLPEALRWGTACGAAAASLGGTAMGSRKQVEALTKKVQISSVFDHIAVM